MTQQGTQPAQQQQAQQPTATISGAGFSMNVKMIEKHEKEVLMTFRAPRANQAERLINHYENVVEQLLGAGWTPMKAAVRAPQESGQSAGAGDVPTCPVHGSQMR